MCPLPLVGHEWKRPVTRLDIEIFIHVSQQRFRSIFEPDLEWSRWNPGRKRAWCPQLFDTRPARQTRLYIQTTFWSSSRHFKVEPQSNLDLESVAQNLPAWHTYLDLGGRNSCRPWTKSCNIRHRCCLFEIVAVVMRHRQNCYIRVFVCDDENDSAIGNDQLNHFFNFFFFFFSERLLLFLWLL